jgi:hypothetical protein
MSEKRTKAEKLQQQIERAEKITNNFSDEKANIVEETNEANMQVVRTVTHSN